MSTKRSASSSRTIRVVKVKLDELKPHPLQHEYFPMEEEHIKRLAKSMMRNGQQTPIEVLPDGTIVAGHCRAEAARMNKWEEIDAIVRNDLAEQGELEIEFRLLADNYERRHLTPLQRARCALRLKELASARRGVKLDEYTISVIRGNTRDEVGKQLDISGRQVSRVLRVLDTPREVQDAVEEGLSMTLAGKVAGLEPDKQEKIADAIQKGKDPKKVIQSFLAEKKVAERGVTSSYHELVKGIEDVRVAFKNRVGEICLDATEVDEEVKKLRRGIDFLKKLIAHAQKRKAECKNGLKGLAGKTTGGHARRGN